MKVTFAGKLTIGFVLCSLLIGAIAFFFEYFGYFGFVELAGAVFTAERSIRGHFFLFPDPESLHLIFDALDRL